MAKETGQKLIAQNKKARHEYTILDTYECGLVLTGTEVKSLREGRANLVDGYAYIQNHEAWIDNVFIPEYTQGTWTNHAARRKRKLLRCRCTSRTAGSSWSSRSRSARSCTTSARRSARSRTPARRPARWRRPGGASGVNPLDPRPSPRVLWRKQHGRSPSELFLKKTWG